MTQLEIPAPNLLGGVSQQGIRRLPNQLEQQDNAWSSPIDGLRKRHPTDHVAKLISAPSPRQARVHTIVRGAEEYVVVLLMGQIKAFYPSGTEIPIYGPAGAANFIYVDMRTANLLTGNESFSTGWSLVDAAMTVTSTTRRGPLDFGAGKQLGNEWENIGDEGIYRQNVSGGSSDLRKHFSVFVHAVNDDEDTAVRLQMHEGAPASASVGGCTFTYDAATQAWSAGAPDPDMTAHAEPALNGWYRLKLTYEPDGTSPSPLDYVDVVVKGTGILGPDKLVHAFGAHLVDSDDWHDPETDFPPYTFGTADDLRATSVQDYTFVVDRKVAVLRRSDLSSAQPGGKDQAFVWVRQASYAQDYTVSVQVEANPTRTVTVTTLAGAGGGGGTGTIQITTQAIATALADNTTGLGQYAELDISHAGSVIRIRPTTGGDEITKLHVSGADGGDYMVAIDGEVAHFSDLPLEFVDGMRIKVAGDPGGGEDDYWVEFNEDRGSVGEFATGKWHETMAPVTRLGVTASTMPHQLIRKYDDGAGTVTGTPNMLYFEWGPATWTDREVGDNNSNPWPSFCSAANPAEASNYITDVFFHRGRLGFLSGMNAIFSATDDLFNFWRSTVRALLDSDRIDVAAAHRSVSQLHAAIPIDQRLLLFSRNTVFALAGSPILTAQTAEAPPVLEEQSSPEALPVAVGSSVLFAARKGDWSILHEAFPLTERTSFRSQDLTAPCPRYIPGTILDLAATNLEGEMVVAIRADGDPSVLYIFKAFTDGGQRVQSALWRYPMGAGARVIGMGWIDDRLFLAIERGDALYLESMRVGSGLVDADSELQVCLDRRVTDEDTSPTYVAATGTTNYSMPYDVTSAAAVRVVTRATDAAEGGIDLQIAEVVTTPGSNVVKVHGDHADEPVWIGEAYSMVVNPGRPVVRSQSVTGGLVPNLAGGELLTGGAIWLSGPIHLDLVVAREHGLDNIDRFRGPHLGSGPTIGAVQAWSRRHEFSVLAQPDEVTVTLESDSHLSTKVEALEWYMGKQGRARRLPG